MNREIKFRAWDIKKGIMQYARNTSWFEFAEYCNPCIVDSGACGYDRVANENIKIMQYTGLKDKNLKDNREVYEGDILEFIYGNKATVEWDCKNTGWIARSIKQKMKIWNLADCLIENALVVGNVFENSEMLGDK